MAVELVLMELQSSVSDCAESLLFKGADTINWCSQIRRTTAIKTSFNMSADNKLEIIYSKSTQRTGGRFWVRLEGKKFTFLKKLRDFIEIYDQITLATESNT